MSGHVSPVSLYITIFLALMVLTAVTVFAAFVDLHSASEFEAGEDIGHQVGIELPDIVHHAVNAESNQKAVAFGLKVNIGRAQIEGLAQNIIGLGNGLGEFAAEFADNAVFTHNQAELRSASWCYLSHLWEFPLMSN